MATDIVMRSAGYDLVFCLEVCVEKQGYGREAGEAAFLLLHRHWRKCWMLCLASFVDRDL